MKIFDQLKSLSGFVSETGRNSPMDSPLSSPDSNSCGNSPTLELTPEELVSSDQASEIDLEMANSELNKLWEHIQALEKNLENALNENAKLRVKQEEDTKLKEGLESKLSLTKMQCDQLTETLQQLVAQIRVAEQDKNLLEDKASASLRAFDDLHFQMSGVTAKLESAEENLRNSEKELVQLKLEKKEREIFYIDDSCKAVNLIREKDALIKELEGAVTADKLYLQSLNSQLEEVHFQITDLTAKLESAEEKMRNSEKELMELKLEKEERETLYIDDSCRNVNLIQEKDALIKDLEGAAATDKLHLQSLNYKLEEVQREMNLKEEMCKFLTGAQNSLEEEKSALLSSNENFSRRVLASVQDRKYLEDLVHCLVENLTELDINNATFSENVIKLNHQFEICYKLMQQEKDLVANHTQLQFSRLHDQLLHANSENDVLRSENEDLKSNNVKMQKHQELVMAQHAKQSLLAEEKFQKMENEAETLAYKKIELETLVTNLEERIIQLLEASKVSESKMQGLLRTISTLGFEYQDIQEKLQACLHSKAEETKGLRKEIVRHEERVATLENVIEKFHNSLEERDHFHQKEIVRHEDIVATLEKEIERLHKSLEKKEQYHQKEIVRHEDIVATLESEVEKLHDSLDEKEKFHQLLRKREKQLVKLFVLLQTVMTLLYFVLGDKQLEDQTKEIQGSLASAEGVIVETKKQYDLMLESEQIEFSKHVKELSQRNEQAIKDIKMKFDLEKLKIMNEKEKADKLVAEIEMQCDRKLAEKEEEFRKSLMLVQEEHASLISRIKQEYDKKEVQRRADHDEELKHVELQAEDELREKIISMNKEHEIQMKTLRFQYEDEYRRLQAKLELQKSKEERQKALLKLQWKVMDGNSKGDQEVILKKDYSSSSIKTRDTGIRNRSHYRHRRVRKPKNEEKINKTDSPFIRTSQTPITNMLKEVDKENTGGMINIPKHTRKVTRCEYEVETTNGRTITKRKTKSTVMFEDPKKLRRMTTPNAKSTKDALKELKGYEQSQPSTIGELFSEGYLNPYTDYPCGSD